MNARTWVLLLTAGSLLGGCLRGEKVQQFERSCSCSGVHCIDGTVRKRVPTDDWEADPCLSCGLRVIGECIEGCTDETFELPGCPVAYACRTWERVKPGAACSSDRDCEPGEIDGAPANTLRCRQGACTDEGAAKWAELAAPISCSGSPLIGPHPDCAGAACLGATDQAATRTCSVARCIEDGDCPAGWHCRCQEEGSWKGLRAWRWCVPDVPPASDAGAKAEDDAGTGAANDAGAGPDADAGPDAG